MPHELPDEDQMRFFLEDQDHHSENLAQQRRQTEDLVRDFDEHLLSLDGKLARLASLAEQREKTSYELGRLSVHIEQLEEVMQEKERLRLEEAQNRATLAVLDNHLDWLEIEVKPLPNPSEDGPWQEPHHDRR